MGAKRYCKNLDNFGNCTIPQVEFFSSSSRDNAILCKNYNHSKCVQNIVFYAGRQLNIKNQCKKPCQINTFQVSKSDINAEMQEKDYMGIFMTIATSNVLVNEEYLLYDLNNIISAVGGSMGLFLSFW